MKSSTRKIREHLGLEESVRTVPTGSMWPTIRPGDQIRFRRDPRSPRLGEIWVARLGEKDVVHRVIWRSGSRVLFKGDWMRTSDGWVPTSAFFGPVVGISRGGVWRPTNRLADRALGLGISATGALLQHLRGFAGFLKRHVRPSTRQAAGSRSGRGS